MNPENKDTKDGTDLPLTRYVTGTRAVIRRARFEDTGRIAEIHVRSWQAAYKDSLPADFLAALDFGQRAAMWKSCVENKGELFVVEDDDSEIIGFVCVGPSRDEDLKNDTELFAIYLDPEFYGSGVGTLLWKEVEKGLSTDWVHLWVLSTNAIGIAFYEKNGFRPDGMTKSFEIEGQVFDERRYRKRLGGGKG